jgi:hypothetical protein
MIYAVWCMDSTWCTCILLWIFLGWHKVGWWNYSKWCLVFYLTFCMTRDVSTYIFTIRCVFLQWLTTILKSFSCSINASKLQLMFLWMFQWSPRILYFDADPIQWVTNINLCIELKINILMYNVYQRRNIHIYVCFQVLNYISSHFYFLFLVLLFPQKHFHTPKYNTTHHFLIGIIWNEVSDKLRMILHRNFKNLKNWLGVVGWSMQPEIIGWSMH